MKPRLYYIVNFSRVRKPYYWDLGFLTKEQAKGAIDAYLPRGYYSVIRGDLLAHFEIRKKKTNSRWVITPLERNLFPNSFLKELKIKGVRGKGLTPYKFKDAWEPITLRGNERRKAIRMRGRYKIRKQILK